MPVARHRHACGLIADTEDGTVMVVVAGGLDSNSKGTYFWVLGSDDWTDGPWLAEGSLWDLHHVVFRYFSPRVFTPTMLILLVLS